MEGNPTAHSTKSREAAWRVDQLCIEQRQRWLTGAPLPLDSLLELNPTLRSDREALFQLAYNELRVREELGEEVDPAEYERQYPELSQRLVRQLQFCRDIESAASIVACPSSRLEWDGTTIVPQSGSWPMVIDGASRFQGTRRFCILRVLGDGGMGRVFAVYDNLWNQRVALKILHNSDSESLVRIRREFRMLSDFCHPNLVQLFELHQTERFCFFTMELLDGVDPPAWCTAPAGEAGMYRPVLDRVCEVLRQLAIPLNVLHKSGMVHCDVKGSNLLVVEGGRLVLLDFGLVDDHVRESAARRDEEHVGGTLIYMAPERLQAGGGPSPASDWYSAGVLLYLLLTGRYPFVGTTREIVHQKRYGAPRPPDEINREVPQDLSLLCLELLSRRAAERPSGGEVLERLGTQSQRRDAPALTDERDLFLGREVELARLEQAWQRTRGGRTTGVLLHGHSGIGKTAVAQAFLRRVLQQDDAWVLRGRCYETESVAFKALDRLVDDLAAQLREIPPDERAAVLPPTMAMLGKMFPALARLGHNRGAGSRLAPDPHELRKQAAAAFQELLLRLALRRPVVLFIDDIQWGDADSGALLTSLLKSRRETPLLLLFSCRSENLSGSTFPDHIREVATDYLEEIEVLPLPADHGWRLAELCLEQTGAGLPMRAQQIAAEAGGSPFLILALARWAREDAPGGDRTPSAELSVDALLADSVSQLDPAAQAVLEIFAVAGHPLEFLAACHAAGIRHDQQKILMVLRARRFLRTDQVGETVSAEPYHDRIREGLVRQLPRERRRNHHLQLAHVLESDPAAHARHLTQHYLAAGERRLAGRHAQVAAAQSDEALAFDDAVRFYRLALQTHEGPAEERRELKGRLAEALASVNRGAEAGEVFLELSRQQDHPNAAAPLLQRAAEHFLAAGRFDKGIAIFRELLQGLKLRWPRSPREACLRFVAGRLLLRLRGFGFQERDASQIDRQLLLQIDTCYSALTAVAMVDLMRGLSFAPKCILLSLRSGDLGRVARAHAIEAFLCYMNVPRRSRRAERLFAHADHLARRSKTPRVMAHVQFFRASAAFYQGDWSQVVRLSDGTEEFIRNRCVGLAWESATLHIWRLHALFYLGQFRKQADAVRAAIDEAHQLNDPYFGAEARTGTSCTAWLLEDAPQRAQAKVDEARRIWPGHDDLCPTFVNFIAEVQILLYQGRGSAAWEYMTRVWPQMVAAKQLRLGLLRAEMSNLRGRAALAAAAECDDPRQLLRSAEADARRLARMSYPAAKPLATLLRAGAARGCGQTDRAEVLLREAIAGCDGHHLSMYAAAARWRLGQLLGGSEGEELLAQAQAAFDRETVKAPPRMVALLAP